MEFTALVLHVIKVNATENYKPKQLLSSKLKHGTGSF